MKAISIFCGLILIALICLSALAAYSFVEISWEFTSGPVRYISIEADTEDQVEDSNEYNNFAAEPTWTPFPPCTPDP